MADDHMTDIEQESGAGDCRPHVNLSPFADQRPLISGLISDQVPLW